MIKDPFGRSVTDLRISITQRCNFNCFYCHREGEDKSKEIEMTPEEIERIVRISSKLGIKKVKLTGGEPLLREDIVEIVSRTSSIPGITEVAITTNGTLLNKYANQLSESGLTRINVSLDTLIPKIYRKITCSNSIKMVIEGIKTAVEAGLSPVKINMVLLKGLNEDHIWEMIHFTIENKLILQLIEFEDFEENEIYKKHHLDLEKIEDELEESAWEIRIRKMQHRKKILLNGGGEVEIVKPMHNTLFCENCRKMRITSDGKFKPCLFRSDNHIDFLTPMREGISDEGLKKLFLEAVDRRRPYFM
jgi:cyclic pyranopterin phosphate synthase